MTMATMATNSMNSMRGLCLMMGSTLLLMPYTAQRARDSLETRVDE